MEIRPVLVIFTSHRMDCLTLALDCLDRHVGTERFKHIYIIANAVTKPHFEAIKAWCAPRANATWVAASPRGIVPAVMDAFNTILAWHRDDVILKMDEDIFVTPGWFESLTKAYADHRDDESVLLCSSIAPLGETGWTLMEDFLAAEYPAEHARVKGFQRHYSLNRYHHRFLWEKVLEDNLCWKHEIFETRPYLYLDRVIINCILFDRRLIDRVHPFPLKLIGEYVPDERLINLALGEAGLRVAYPTTPLVHHYSHSHAYCLDFLLREVPVSRIRAHLLGEGSDEAWRDFAPPPGAFYPLAGHARL